VALVPVCSSPTVDRSCTPVSRACQVTIVPENTQNGHLGRIFANAEAAPIDSDFLQMFFGRRSGGGKEAAKQLVHLREASGV
jgi:hypothetical protein